VARLRRPLRVEDRGGGRTVDARRFLYLDSEATKELLAGLERGTYSVERESRSQEAGREVGGKIGLGLPGADVGASAGRTTSAGHRTERDLAQTPASLFARLAGALREQGSLRHLDALDASAWAELKPGHIIEMVASLTVMSFGSLADAVMRAQAVRRGFGDEPGDSTLEKAMREWQRATGSVLVNFYNLVRHFPGVYVDPEVVATIPESPDFAFHAKLDAREIRTKPQAREDSVTLLAQIDHARNGDAVVTILGIYR
jgi:hypothetical protein